MNISGLAHEHDKLKNRIDTLQVVTAYSQACIGDYKYSAASDDFAGWIKCDGRSLDKNVYSALFELIGTAFGGSGSTFKVPDFRGRVPGAIGSGVGLTARALGAVVGAETHTLTVNEMPAHDHGGTTGAAGFGTGVVNPAVSLTTTDVADNDGSHTHSISSQGGGQPHNNMQPTLFGGNVFIFAGIVY